MCASLSGGPLTLPMSNRNRVVLLSPIVVLVLGHATARVSGHLWGVWSWIPVTLVYWITLALIMTCAGGWTAYRQWLQPSQGALGWRLLALLTTVLFIPVFLLNYRSLNQPWVVSSWLALAIVDPWLEEGYWRGLLMDSAKGWPSWLMVAYTTFWFGLSHPLLLGVNVKALSGFPGFFGTVFTGVIWSTVYLKTRSLRWPILSHCVADLLSVSVIVFSNRAIFPR